MLKWNEFTYDSDACSIKTDLQLFCVVVFLWRDKMFPESTVRNISYQILQGLAFMHKHGMS